MNSMESAPKGGGAEYVTDPEWVEPPKILLFFDGGAVSVGCWDWYYVRNDEVNNAWTEPVSGQLLRFTYGEPIGWMEIPEGKV